VRRVDDSEVHDQYSSIKQSATNHLFAIRVERNADGYNVTMLFRTSKWTPSDIRLVLLRGGG
jgi:hypothetical protein